MMPSLPSPLQVRDCRLLHFVRFLVPAVDREEWVRSWAAELWCFRHTARPLDQRSLFFGVVQDAFWLRAECARNALSGTATLCLLTLLLLVMVAGLPALAPTGHWRGLDAWLLQQGIRFFSESALIVFVSYATASSDIEQSVVTWRQFWLRARLFQSAKTLLVLLLAFVLSADLGFPLRAPLPLTAEFLRTMSFVLFALLGLRWSFRDGVGRCKHCLRSLSAPARVGRPSYNFLEWNGTEMLCRMGHGLLSVPEIETSWCRSSAWISLSSS